MSLRFAHAGDFHLDEDRYFADTAQCLEWFVADGQFVLVNEAVNLGIATYNMRQGEGIRYETLFRDETVGALDAANGKEYVRMLRRAMDLGGLHQVMFICHTPLVWELADNILSVGRGCVAVGDSGHLPLTPSQTASSGPLGDTIEKSIIKEYKQGSYLQGKS
jgi:hypothetical protein